MPQSSALKTDKIPMAKIYEALKEQSVSSSYILIFYLQFYNTIVDIFCLTQPCQTAPFPLPYFRADFQALPYFLLDL